MLKHLLISAIRSIWRNRLYTIIIILSLSIGFSFVTFLSGYNIHELSTDSFHPLKSEIYRVFTDDPFGDREQFSSIPFKAADYLNENYNEIEKICRIFDLNNKKKLVYKENTLEDLKIIATDHSFFELFDFPFTGQSASTLLPGEIILTKETASRLLVGKNPIGTMVDISSKENNQPLIISGIIEPLRENSHLDFDGVVFFDDFLDQQKRGSCYVLLNDKTSPGSLVKKINNDDHIARPFDKEDVKYHLQNLSGAYFNNAEPMKHQVTGNMSLIKTNFFVSAFIIIISLFNFISLYGLYTKSRWKEFGIRKTLGSSRRHFLNLVMTEVFLLIVITFALTFVFVSLLHHRFAEIFSVSFQLPYYLNYKFILIFFGLILLITLLILFVFSNKFTTLQPIGLLKNFKPGQTRGFSFFTLQFTVAIGLIIASLIFMKQIYFIKNKPLGFNRHVVQVMPPDKEEREKLPAYKQELLRNPQIKQVSLCSGNPISDNIIIMDKLPNGEMYTSYLFLGDENYLKTIGFELIDGSFQKDKEGVFINEKFVKYLNLEDPVGSFLPNSDREILGVIKDFNIYSLKKEIPNLYLIFRLAIESDRDEIYRNYTRTLSIYTFSGKTTGSDK